MTLTLEEIYANGSKTVRRSLERQGLVAANGAVHKSPKPKTKAKAEPAESKLVAALWMHLGQAKLREGWVKEHVFHPERKWRFDLAHPESKLAVECDGLLPASKGGGRHQRKKGFSDDCEKVNAAILLGWRVLRFTRVQIVEEASAVRVIRAALEGRTL